MFACLKFSLIFLIVASCCGWSIQSPAASKFTREQPNYKQGANDPQCGSEKFACDGICKNLRVTCDGIFDCKDETDESYETCHARESCNSSKFRCKSGVCIDKSLLCNGMNNCIDRDDENFEQCKDYSCNKNKFHCKSGACIEKSMLCDGMYNCIDGDDETFEQCKDQVCNSTNFRCKSGACIDTSFLCNGMENCIDGDDETFEQCKDHPCSSTKFHCKMGPCIAKSMLCDGWNNCNDREDETFELCKDHYCTSTKFHCKSGVCIDKNMLCDGINNCIDGEDETYEQCKYQACSSSKFHCKSGPCIDKSMLCDGRNNCNNREDETFELCKDHVCSSDKFHCKSGICIDKSMLCDGIYNCIDGEDESYDQCKYHNCSNTKFRCKSGACIDKSVLCDGEADCYDGDDETLWTCRNHQYTQNSTSYKFSSPDQVECILPAVTPDKTYTIYCPVKTDTCRRKPGEKVPLLTTIIFECVPGYAKYHNSQIISTESVSTCLAGLWRPEVTKCKKICNDLNSLDVNLTCSQYLNGPIVPCTSILLEGATFISNTCKLHHSIMKSATSGIKQAYLLANSTPPRDNYGHATCKNDGTWDKEFLNCTPDDGMTSIHSEELMKQDEQFCTLPITTPDKNYTIKCHEWKKNCIGKYGDKAKLFTKILFRCSKGYTRKEGLEFSSICHDGSWFPSIAKCSKICDPLPSNGLDFTCSQSRTSTPHSCPDTLIEGNVVYPRCKPHHHPIRDLNYRDQFLVCQNDGSWDREFFVCTADCGKMNASFINLIGNGQRERPGEAPWNVAIYDLQDPQKPSFICGGTLISTQLVLSAAHCFDDPVLYTMLNESLFHVVIGKYSRDFESIDNNDVKKYKIKKIYTPDEYFGYQANLAADLAILRLSDKISLSDQILPACVHWFDYTPFKPAEGTFGKLSGFGETENGTASLHLLTANLPYISYANCLKKLKVELRDSLSRDKFCAGINNGTGARVGDSGAGLMFLEGRPKLYYIRGVVSYQIKTLPSIAAFTDVALYLSWITTIFQDINESK